ncbi:MAG: regulatory protein RecX [Bacteroidetes bacterium]|nr:MAG: regulatory protein RecX [Bacteroidota bacterium]
MDDEIRIISVKAKKNRQNCIIIFSNDDTFKCSYDIVLKYKLGNNSIISSDLFSEIKKEQRIYDVKQVAFNYVSYKPRTEKQIRQRLKEKGFEKVESDSAIGFLSKFDLVDDEKYSKQFIADYLKRKSVGKSKLISELLRKGIDKALAEDSVEKFFSKDDTLEYAMKAVNKKLRVIRHKPLEKQRDSLIRFLFASGFDWDIIRIVLKEIKFGVDE